MTAIVLSQFAKRVQDTINGDCAGDLVVNPFYVDLLTTDLLAGNVIDLGILPAGHTINGAKLIADDLDTGTTLTLDVGLMSGTPGTADNTRTVGQELFIASTAAQTGGVVDAAVTKTALTIMAQPYDRSIGVKVVAAPTGATAGRLRLLVTMYATNSGVQY
jgi:hypothetical protein